MLKELCKKDKDWRDIAYKICRDKMLADDLVNDMYIKLHETNKKYCDINEWYVWVTIANLYKNILKKNKQFIKLSLDINEILNSSLKRSNLIGKVFIRLENNILVEDEITIKRIEVDNALKKMTLWDREILLHTSETSLRKLSKETGIGVTTLHRSRHKALQTLKELL